MCARRRRASGDRRADYSLHTCQLLRLRTRTQTTTPTSDRGARSPRRGPTPSGDGWNRRGRSRARSSRVCSISLEHLRSSVCPALLHCRDHPVGLHSTSALVPGRPRPALSLRLPSSSYSLFRRIRCMRPRAILATAPYAASLGFAGGVIATDALAKHGGGRLAMRLVLAAVFLLAALLMYQPAAMMFWVSVAVTLVVPRAPVATWRILGGSLVVAGVALALTLITLELSLAISGWDLVAKRAPRASGQQRPWLLYDALPRALDLHYFDRYPSGALGLAVAAVILLGLALRARGDPKYAVRLGLAAAALVPHSPTRRISYSRRLGLLPHADRTLDAVRPLLRGGRHRDWTIRPREAGRCPPTGSSQRSSRHDHGCPGRRRACHRRRSRERKPPVHTARDARAGNDPQPDCGDSWQDGSRVVFRQASKYQGGASEANFDEFAFPSSAADWVPEPVVALVLREQGRLGRTLSVKVIPRGLDSRGRSRRRHGVVRPLNPDSTARKSGTPRSCSRGWSVVQIARGHPSLTWQNG